MKIPILLSLLFCSVISNAQNLKLEEKYEERTVFLYGNQYMMAGEKLPKRSLPILLSEFPDSRSEYQLSRKWGTIGRIISLISVTLPLYGLYQYRQNNKDILPYGIASIGAAYLSIPFTVKGKKHLHKSVWLYNRNVLVKD